MNPKVDPETLVPSESRPSPGRWSRPPVPEKFSPVRWVAYGAVVVGTATLVAGPALHSGLILVSGATIFLTACVASLELERRDRERTMPRSLPLLENPEDEDVCLVDMLVSVNGAIVGQDRGAAWFESDCLHYSGYRTSFVIGGQDVLPTTAWGRFATSEVGLPASTVPLRLESSNAYVGLSPVSGDGVRYYQEVRFRARLAEFREHPQPSSGSRQWPPLEPYRGLRR